LHQVGLTNRFKYTADSNMRGFIAFAAFYTISDTTRSDKRYWSHKMMTLYNISIISLTHSVQSDRHTRDTRQAK